MQLARRQLNLVVRRYVVKTNGDRPLRQVVEHRGVEGRLSTIQLGERVGKDARILLWRVSERAIGLFHFCRRCTARRREASLEHLYGRPGGRGSRGAADAVVDGGTFAEDPIRLGTPDFELHA